MAKVVLLAQYVGLNAVDESSNIAKAELELESDAQDTTTFGDAGWKTFLAGLKSATLNITYKNDVAAAAFDSRMFALFATNIAFEVRVSNAVVGVSNPKFTGTVVVNSYKPIGGGVGDVNAADVSWPTSGAVTRATA